MKILAQITQKAGTPDWPIKHVSYLREDDVVWVMVSHSPTWELNAMKPAKWEDCCTEHPILAEISFRPGAWLLTRSARGGAWDEERQK